MGYSNRPEMPDWDPDTKALVDKHKKQRERVVEAFIEGLPDLIQMPKEQLKTVIREAFDGALEAVAHDLT